MKAEADGSPKPPMRERIEKDRERKREYRAIIDSIIGGYRRQTSKQLGIRSRTPGGTSRLANPHSLFNLTTPASGVIKKVL